MDRIERGSRSTVVGLITNSVLVAVKITAGVLGNSYALVADGVESTADIFSSLIVWRGLRLSGRKADERFPFGYGKAEAIAAAVVALMLLTAAVAIAVQAIREILTPHHSPAPFTLLVLVGVILVKEVLFRHVLSVGQAVGSTAVQVDAWHHRSDAITSAAAFVGISIALVGGPAWAVADDYAALVASLIIAFNGIRFLRPAALDLMDAAPPPDVVVRITDTARGVEGVMGVEKVLARRFGMGYRVVVHIEADPEMTLHDAHILGGRVRRALISDTAAVVDAVIHMEPYTRRAGVAEDERSPAPGPLPQAE